MVGTCHFFRLGILDIFNGIISDSITAKKIFVKSYRMLLLINQKSIEGFNKCIVHFYNMTHTFTIDELWS